jgi:hypothetical protein
LSAPTHIRNIGPAHEANKRYAAETAAEDPVKRARHIRTARVAYSRGYVTVEELTTPLTKDTP